jgi:nucleoside-diphosphate-sugar epimerase
VRDCADPIDFTILGATGTIGSALAASLRSRGFAILRVERATLPRLFAGRRNLGHVIDCIGLTGDFRSRPLETAEAHIGIPARCLAELQFKSFLYLSSTRVYARADATVENTLLPSTPTDPSDLYNLTKLTGEALCLGDPRPGVRVVRLSNVYGPRPGSGTFLGQIIAAGRATGHVVFRQSALSAKDYVSLNDVVYLLAEIARNGQNRLYNLAAGRNTTHGAIGAILRSRPGWQTTFESGAATVCYPPIDISRLVAEFSPSLRNFSSDLPTIASGQEAQCSPSMRYAVA